MTTLKHALCLIMATASVTASAQSKGEMPFSASSEINKSLRQSWIALADFNIEEANSNTHNILSQDPACGIAYVSLFPGSPEERMENIRKAEGAKLSADEKLFVEGLKARLAKQSPQQYFEPLMKKYPRDLYLQLWMMFNYDDPKRSIEIGEGLIKRSAKFAPAYNMLGYLYMNQNDMAKAEAYFDKYIALRPDLANVYDSKGDYMMRADRIEEAIPLFEKAASLGMKISKKKAERARAQLRYPKPSEHDAVTIEKMIQERFEAVKNKNVDALLKNTSEQAVEIFDNQRVNVGLGNLRQRVSEMFKNRTYTKANFSMKSTNGAGPIAVAYGQVAFLWSSSTSTETTNQNRNVIYILRKHPDGNWKILANHFYGSDGDAPPISPEDRASINQIITGWDAALAPGQELSAKHFDAFAALHSAQAIEIFSNQMSNIGLPNLRSRWEQYTGTKMETNSLGLLGIEGVGRRAVAWGIGNQNFSMKGSTEMQKYEFPWVMILTKEKDDAWRILATHWGN